MKTDLHIILAVIACHAALMIGAMGIWYMPLSAGFRLNMLTLLVYLTGCIAMWIPFLARKP